VQRGGCFQVSGSEEKATARANFEQSGWNCGSKLLSWLCCPGSTDPEEGTLLRTLTPRFQLQYASEIEQYVPAWADHWFDWPEIGLSNRL